MDSVIENRKKEVNQILNQPKEKLPTTFCDQISFFWHEKKKLVSWKVGWTPKEMINPIKVVEIETDNFKWTDQDKVYQVIVRRLTPPHNDWDENIKVFVRVQSPEEIQYYRSLASCLRKKNDNKPIFFLCYEVFFENNFEEIVTPQSVIDQHLYNRGSIFECPECKGKVVIKACGMTSLSVYGVTSSELCKCKNS
jgi:hypothetical protein